MSVELHEGIAEVTGWVSCDSNEKASCTIEVGGVRVCTDDGGSEGGPIDCDGEIGEVEEGPVEGVVECVDPVNPEIVITKTFSIAGSLGGPIRF